jgi:hypothetical protein
VHRGNEDAAYPLLLEHAQVPAFLVNRLVRVAQDHGVPRGLRVVLCAAGHLGEERVGDVQHDQPKAAAPAGPELARGAVRYEPELLHRGLDASAGERPHQMGVVQHVRNRADRYPFGTLAVYRGIAAILLGPTTVAELWNPANLGYLAGYAAVEVASGKINGTQGQTFSAGKLGSFTVGADKTVLLGPPFVFTSANIGQFNF